MALRTRLRPSLQNTKDAVDNSAERRLSQFGEFLASFLADPQILHVNNAGISSNKGLKLCMKAR